ncbi:hypothetical protein D3C87_1408190 [compost metagenome]
MKHPFIVLQALPYIANGGIHAHNRLLKVFAGTVHPNHRPVFAFGIKIIHGTVKIKGHSLPVYNLKRPGQIGHVIYPVNTNLFNLCKAKCSNKQGKKCKCGKQFKFYHHWVYLNISIKQQTGQG